MPSLPPCPKCGAALDPRGACPACASPTNPGTDLGADTGAATIEQRFPPTITVTGVLSGSGEPRPASAGTPEVVRYFGDYELERELARGGMGVVYKARQVSLNRAVALKMILAGQLATDAEVRRFYQEAESAAGLDHPGIVPVYEVGQHETQHYYAMSLIDGSSLAQRVAEGPLPLTEAAEVVRQIAEAVEFAHHRGVIHRDLKPTNVLIDAQGRPRVTDFGLAKKIAADSSLTATGNVVGTPSYMPPEQAAGHSSEIGPTSDVYSLGAILYCLLTGRPPFQASSVVETLRQVIDQEPVPPRQLNAAVPLDLETITLKCLQKERHRRYSTAQALADDLGRWLRGEPIAARPVGALERAARWCRRNPGIAGLAAALGLVLIAVAAGSTWAAYQYRELAGRERLTARAESFARTRADRLAEQERRTASAEKRARDEAERLRSIAELKSAESQQRLVSRLVSEGSELLQGGDLLAALPWFVEGLATEAGHPQREPLHRLRLTMTLRASPRLVHALFLPSSPEATSLTPDGRTVITADRGMVEAIDVATGERHAVKLEVPPAINGFTTTPDGRFASWLVVTQDERSRRFRSELHVWDVAQRRPVGPPVRSDGTLDIFQLRDDGRWLLAAVDRGAIIVVDPTSGRRIGPVIAPAVPITRAHFVGDGRRLVVHLMDQSGGTIAYSVQVWDAVTGRPISPLLTHPTYVGQAELSADGSRLLTVAFAMPASQGAARVWDVASGTLLAGPFHHGEVLRGQVVHAALSPDGAYLATAGLHDARIWDLARGRIVGEPLSHGEPVAQVVFSPDGRRLATVGGQDGVARVWDLASQTLLLPPLRQSTAIARGQFSPDGRLLLTLGRNSRTGVGEVRAWDLTRDDAQASSKQRFDGHRLWIEPGAQRVVIREGGTDMPFVVPGGKVPPPTLQVLERRTGRAVSPVITISDQPQAEVVAVSLSGDGRKLAAAIDPMRDRRAVELRAWELRAWDVASGQPLEQPLRAPGPVSFVVLAADGRRAAVVFRSYARSRPGDRLQNYNADEVWLWDVLEGRGKPLPVPVDRIILLVAFSPDGGRLLTVQPGLARLWDPANGAPIGPPIEEPVTSGLIGRLQSATTARGALLSCADFAPDGRLLVVSTGTTKAHRLNPATGAAVGPPLEDRDDVHLVRFSGDGSRVILAGKGDAPARVWDAGTGSAVGRPLAVEPAGATAGAVSGPTRRLEDAVLNDDGEVALTAGPHGIQLWEVASGMPLSPAIPTTGRFPTAWFDGKHHLVMHPRGQELVTLDLTPDGRPIGDLRRLAGLLSGARIDDVLGPVGVEPAMLQSAWAALRGRSTALPEEPSEPAQAWHRRLASEAETTGHWFVARVHLDAIIAAAPDDPEPGRPPAETYRRRGEALARLGEWDRAAADFARVLAGWPLDVRANEALAVLLAYRRDLPGYQARCATLRRFIGRRPSHPALAWIDLMTLMPGGIDDPATLIVAADAVAAVSTPGDPAPLASRARACYRDGRFEPAVRDLRESLAAYGRVMKRLRGQASGRAAEEPAIAVEAADVSPKRNEGTPFDWLFLAMAEQRLGHAEIARAWLDKANRWIDQARRDPSDPSVLGGLSDPRSRAMARMVARVSIRPELGPPGAGSHGPLQTFLPTWRQMLALEVVRREAASLIEDSARARELPEDVFAR